MQNMVNFYHLNFQVPEVTRVDYQLIDISEDGFVRNQNVLVTFQSVMNICDSHPNLFQVSLLMENGGTKDDLRLPNDEQLLSQVSSYCRY